MKLRTTTHRDEPELNVTSLIDVVLLLLIFFMLTTTFVRPSQIAIELPEAGVSSALPGAAKDELEITITSKGEFRVNGRELVDSRPATLEAAIRKIMPDVRKRHVTINADGRARHQDVVTAMDVSGRLGFVEVRITTTRARPVE